MNISTPTSAHSSRELNGLHREYESYIEIMRVKRRKRNEVKTTESKVKTKKTVAVGDTNDVRTVYFSGWRCTTGRLFEKLPGHIERSELLQK